MFPVIDGNIECCVEVDIFVDSSSNNVIEKIEYSLSVKREDVVADGTDADGHWHWADIDIIWDDIQLSDEEI